MFVNLVSRPLESAVTLSRLGVDKIYITGSECRLPGGFCSVDQLSLVEQDAMVYPEVVALDRCIGAHNC